jgi:nitrite reductase/ring-hydroxylating ferredoxin subunit
VSHPWIRLALAHHLPLGQTACADVDGHAIAIFHTGAGLYAVDNDCLHMGGPLCEGAVDGTVVTCPWHGWRYDLTTGARVDRRGSSIDVHAVQVDGGWILVADPVSARGGRR